MNDFKEYGKMVFLSKEAEKKFENLSERETKTVMQMLNKNANDTKMKIEEETMEKYGSAFHSYEDFEDAKIDKIMYEFSNRYENVSTMTKLIASHNITGQMIRLCCVCAKKEDILNLIDDLSESLKDEVENCFHKGK